MQQNCALFFAKEISFSFSLLFPLFSFLSPPPPFLCLSFSFAFEISRYHARSRDESALGISARSALADLNETESENFSAYQGCPNAVTRINTHATIAAI